MAERVPVGLKYDVDAIKQKLEEELKGSKKNSSTSNGKGLQVYKPVSGDVVRFLPFKDGTLMYEVYYHYNVGSTRFFVCPNTVGEKCKICDESYKLYKKAKVLEDKTEQDNIKKAAKRLKNVKRGAFLVYVKNREADNAIMLFNLKAFKDKYEEERSDGEDEVKKIQEWMVRPEYGNIMDVENGHDILLSVKNVRKGEFKYDKKSFEIRPIKSPLTDDANKTKAIVDALPSFEDVFIVSTYEDTCNLYNEMINGVDADDFPPKGESRDKLKEELKNI